MMYTVNIIGAGNTGQTIGHLLVKNQVAKISGICNQSSNSALKAIQFIGDGNCYQEISDLPKADITLITTPDDRIATVSKEFSQNQYLSQGSVVIHCSGSLTSAVLSPVKEKGALTASAHPMRSFANPAFSTAHYQGTFCALEGDQEALTIIQPVLDSIGSATYLIDKENKASYHAAGVFASNYLVALAQQALNCMKTAGIEEKLAMHIITDIMNGTISNLQHTLSPAQSLTGPIHRGDILTIEKHMNNLVGTPMGTLYSMLGNATIELTQHDQNKKMAIREALLSS